MKELELIDFRSFLGLHLGEVASFRPNVVFGPDWKTYLPLFLLVIAATVVTFLSSRMSAPKPSSDQQGMPAGCSSNTMTYVGPAITLMFSFQLPAGVILYWMTGYVFAILQQLYINKFVLNKKKPAQAAVAAGGGQDAAKEGSLAENEGKTDSHNTASAKQLPSGQSSKKGSKGKGKKGGKKKGGKKRR